MTQIIASILLCTLGLNVDVGKMYVMDYLMADQHYEYDLHSSFYKWEGGKEIEEHKFRNMIRTVLAKIDFIPEHENVVSLVYETARVESKAGLYIRQIKGTALGVYQIEEATYHDMMKWLKFKPERYAQVMQFYNKRLSLRENLTKNIVFQTVMCALHYYRYYKEKLPVIACSKYSRAKMWKDKYNTRAGKGTRRSYMVA